MSLYLFGLILFLPLFLLLVVIAVQSLSCVRLGSPMNCSTPGFPVLHYLLEFGQTHVHCVNDVIHPLLPPSPLPSVFPSIRVLKRYAIRYSSPQLN